MAFKGGVKEAAKLLSGLNYEKRLKVLELIVQQDPEMAELLKKNMVTFEDLKDLSIKQFQELLREISIDDLALGLRVASDELKKHILGNISSTMRKDIEDVLLGPPQLASKVEEAQEKVLSVVRSKLDKGELVFASGDDEEYV